MKTNASDVTATEDHRGRIGLSVAQVAGRPYSQGCIGQSTTLRGVYREEPVRASAIFDKADTDLAKQLIETSLAKLRSPMREDWVANGGIGAAG